MEDFSAFPHVCLPDEKVHSQTTEEECTGKIGTIGAGELEDRDTENSDPLRLAVPMLLNANDEGIMVEGLANRADGPG